MKIISCDCIWRVAAAASLFLLEIKYIFWSFFRSCFFKYLRRRRKKCIKKNMAADKWPHESTRPFVIENICGTTKKVLPPSDLPSRMLNLSTKSSSQLSRHRPRHLLKQNKKNFVFKEQFLDIYYIVFFFFSGAIITGYFFLDTFGRILKKMCCR